jgi:ubiquinone/menaquinone biosynthesis C-methylase UbiE
MSLWRRIVPHFARPKGRLGSLAGFIMAHRHSNIERSDWAVSLLDLKPTDRVLEIGFGPGVTIQKMARIITEGTLLGLDHSDVMVRQATRRNRKAISEGRVKLLLGSVSDLPPLPGPLDKILDINSFQFWQNPAEALERLKRELRPGGVIVLVHQPRKPGSENEAATRAGEKFAGLLNAAGFTEVRINEKPLQPVSVVSVLGRAPDQT